MFLRLSEKNIRKNGLAVLQPQPAFTYSTSTMETPEQFVKSVHS